MDKAAKRNLIIFSYDFPPSNGGIARLTYEIAIKAADVFNQTIVLTRKKTGPQKPYNLSGKINIVELPSKRISTEVAAIKYLTALKSKEDYYLLCGLWHPEALLAKLAGFKKINVLTHGTELLSGPSLFRKIFWLTVYGRWILNSANIIANSKYTAGLSHKVAPKASITALLLAVNHNYFKPNAARKNDKIIIGTVSRVLQFKGHDFVLKTISNLPQHYKDKIDWYIAGTGPYLPVLKQDVSKYGLDETVKFKGFVPDSELADFYANLDLFILMTRENPDSTQVEGFGLVFLEAQSCGVAVIGANTGGIASAIEHGNGGWLLEQDNEKELSELLISLINKRAIIQQEGTKARERVVKNCTWEIYTSELFKTLQ